jgi:hypothetical protein
MFSRKYLMQLKLLAASGEEMSLRIRRSQSSILYNNFFCIRLPRRKQRGSARPCPLTSGWRTAKPMRSQDSLIPVFQILVSRSNVFNDVSGHQGFFAHGFGCQVPGHPVQVHSQYGGMVRLVTLGEQR